MNKDIKNYINIVEGIQQTKKVSFLKTKLEPKIKQFLKAQDIKKVSVSSADAQLYDELCSAAEGSKLVASYRSIGSKEADYGVYKFKFGDWYAVMIEYSDKETESVDPWFYLSK